MSYRVRCGVCGAQSPCAESYDETMRLAAGNFLTFGIASGYPYGNKHAWSKIVSFCGSCAKKVSVAEMLRSLEARTLPVGIAHE